jgi:two-component system chemotaxis response regulator CheY
MRILIVEDDFISRRLLQVILEPYGVCEIAINGKEAVDAFRMSHEEGNSYDLICLDIMMPEMDGQEVLKRIRAMEREFKISDSKRVKIIISTALDDFDNIKRAFQEQCQAYLVKPITKEKLVDTIKEIGIAV